jgi:hypothetical protein
MLISDHLDLPDRPDLDRFIARLDDAAPETRRARIREFVVTDGLFKGVDALLGSAGERLDQGKDIGRFVYGSFGSGKSHLMTLLGCMLEHDEAVYDHGHSSLRKLRDTHEWLDRRSTLVVRVNMMGKTTFVHALYDAFNLALPPGAPRLDFTDDERVFQLFEKDAERLGGIDEALKSMVDAGLLEGLDGFPQGLPLPVLQETFWQWRRESDRDKRLALAAAVETWRNHGETPVRPDDLWVPAMQGFDRMARHASSLGFNTVTWLIDELVIWLRGQSGAAYEAQINTLSSMVDHDTPRVLPFFVLVAVQTDIAETCPADLSEEAFRKHLNFVSNRFQPALHLEEQDLFQVCAQRVLARRPGLSDAAWRAYNDAVDGTISRSDRLVGELAGGVDRSLIRSLYPFHPSTLRVLVDVTQALSRNRTAIAALYGLLDRHKDLVVGRFLPLSSLWDILFTPDNVRALENSSKSELAQRLSQTSKTWERLAGKVASVTRDDSVPTVDGPTRAETELRQIVRTGLLCQLSEKPYFPDGRGLREAVTCSTLYAFSQADISALTEATGRAKVVRQVRKLALAATEVSVTDGEDPIVDIRVRNLDVDKVLAAARARVQHHHRFAFIRTLLRDVLGLPIGDKTSGPVKVTWRGTDRTGRVVVCNVRRLTYAGAKSEFDQGDDAFLILIDYPFDEEAGCTRQDDLSNAQSARARATSWAACWLPEHLTPTEMAALDDAAAVDIVRQDRNTWLANYSSTDAKELAAGLEAAQATRRSMLEDAVRRVYFHQHELFGMKASLEGLSLTGGDTTKALDSLGRQILNRRYEKHPALGRRASAADLTDVAEWAIKAAMTGREHVVPRGQTGLVEAIAVPLQLVWPGEGVVTARRDGEYLSRVMDWCADRAAFEAIALRSLLSADSAGDGWGFGFTKDISDLFLWWLLQVEGYEAQEAGRSVTVHGLRQLPERFRLVKDEVVDAPVWDKALRVASELLEVKGRDPLPTSPEQAKLVRDAQKSVSQLLEATDSMLRALDAVLGWSGVEPASSQRRAVLASFRTVLGVLRAEVGNAAVVRQLALLVADPSLKGLVQARRTLPTELAAIEAIARSKTAFEMVRDHGDEDERGEVVLRLRAMLVDDIGTSRLAERGAAWAQRAEEVFRAVVARIQKQAPVPSPKTPPPHTRGRTVDVPARKANEVMGEVQGLLREALADFGDQSVRVRIVVEPIDEAGPG